MKKIKLAVIGGFLGAGKTTMILSLAKKLLDEKKTVGIVTNDQGSNLVDTNFLKSAGFPVMEVAGGCFCCNFDEFTRKVNTLARENLPDIILAEPVGSCTDLVATIFRPFQLKRANEFSLAPLCVVVDPKRVRRLMMSEAGSGFQSEINYLFAKQVEEADVIIVNRTDQYEQAETERISSYLKERFKGAIVTRASAKSGENVASLLPVLLGTEAADKPLMELDYEAYGLAEDFLGWFNGTANLSAQTSIDHRPFIGYFMQEIRNEVDRLGSEIAHLKVYLISSGGFVKASITSVDDEPDFSLQNIGAAKSASFVINARINISPEVLEPIVWQAFADATQKYGISHTDYKADCFKPGRPDASARNRATGEDVCCCCKKK